MSGYKLNFGDPTISGWIVTFAYLFCAVLALKKYREFKFTKSEMLTMLIVSFVLLFFGVNKQLDLQTFFFASMKALAKSHGWYEQRAMMQIAFVGILGVALLSMLIIARAFLIKSWSKNKLIWAGLTCLFMFVFLRAAAFNKFRYISDQAIWGFNLYSVLELFSIVLIGLGVYRYCGSDAASEVSAVYDEGDDVYCPRCGAKALAKAVNGRKFKCKECFNKYEVEVSSTVNLM